MKCLTVITFHVNNLEKKKIIRLLLKNCLTENILILIPYTELTCTVVHVYSDVYSSAPPSWPVVVHR